MVSLDERGYAGLVMKPEREISRRQDAPKVYDITTVAYAARPVSFAEPDDCSKGVVRTVRVPTERALDIDTPYDFRACAGNRAHDRGRPNKGLTRQNEEHRRSLDVLMNLEGRVAVVTGGAGHLGGAMAEALAELGCSICLLDRPGSVRCGIDAMSWARDGRSGGELQVDLEQEISQSWCLVAGHFGQYGYP